MSRALAAIVILLALAAPAWPQEGILTLSIEPTVLDLSPGGRLAARLAVTSTSPYQADDVETTWLGPSGFALDPAPEIVAVVAPFATASIPLSIVASSSAPLGETSGSLEIVYSYCIGDLCYQIVESVSVAVRVVSTTQTASAVGAAAADLDEEQSPGIPWPWIAFGAAVLLIAPAALVRKSARVRAVFFVLLLVSAGATLGLGVSLDQHKQAQAVGAVLCTSCVGIETVETLTPRLTAAQSAAVGRVTRAVDLLVFYAPWCRSCPYAEGLVDLVASRNPLVRYRLVNAEVERDLAARLGVNRAGRTIVPAIVRTDTGEVVFGAENLGDRLVELLKEKT